MAARPGIMDQRITINRYTLTDDGYGGKERSAPVKVADAWANVKAGSGGETEQADRLEANARVVFTIRNRPDIEIRATDRINWQGVDYNIRVPYEQGSRAQYLEIEAERGVAQ